MRRGNGDGSIFKLSGKRRNPYAVRVTVGYTDEGRQQYKYVGYYSSKTEAKKALTEYLVNPQKARLERHTLQSVFNMMIEKSKFSDGTIQQYTSGFKQCENLHAREISTIELWELEEILIDKPPSTQARVKKALVNCYKYALKHDFVNKNIAEFLEVESTTPKPRVPFTSEEILELWKNVGQNTFDDIPLFLIYSGLRISELLGLKIEDVNMEDKTFNITKSKTKAGIRKVPIHNKLIPLIENRYNSNNDYLITNSGRRMAYSTIIKDYWYTSHQTHDCRHTFITNLTKVVDDAVIIKKIVGHAISDITEHYTSRTPEELYKAINKLKY